MRFATPFINFKSTDIHPVGTVKKSPIKSHNPSPNQLPLAHQLCAQSALYASLAKVNQLLAQISFVHGCPVTGN